jgi:copper chaperone
VPFNRVAVAAQPREAAMIEFQLPTMTCQHCVKVVTETVQEADPGARLEIDLAAHRLQVETTVGREALAARLADAGYQPA